MKTLYKIVICILSVVIICSFAGCSEPVSGGEDCKTALSVQDEITMATAPTEPETEPTEKITESTTAPVINITEERAKSIAYETLKKEYSEAKTSVIGVDYTAFEFQEIEFYNQSDDTYYNSYDYIKECGHSYYRIDFRNTTQLCDIAYYFVDAFDGKVLHSGYMGD
ncbi:MAG: hypothetical protein K2F65_05870 [Eubacterium sp.]|nr:hypothetical protein [Eubacterium sp.]